MRGISGAIASWEDAEEDDKAQFVAIVRQKASAVHIVASAVTFVSLPALI